MAEKYNFKDKPIFNTTIDLAFQEYNKVYDYDISNKRNKVKSILRAITEKFTHSLNDFEASTIKDMYFDEQTRIKNLEIYYSWSTITCNLRRN